MKAISKESLGISKFLNVTSSGKKLLMPTAISTSSGSGRGMKQVKEQDVINIEDDEEDDFEMNCAPALGRRGRSAESLPSKKKARRDRSKSFEKDNLMEEEEDDDERYSDEIRMAMKVTSSLGSTDLRSAQGITAGQFHNNSHTSE